MKLPNTLPVRIETREDGTKVMTGYAAVFYRAGDSGTEYWLWDDYVERINQGAFSGTLDADVRALFNHDPARILGRTKAKTLRLSQDDVGLKYSIDLPKTREAEDLATLVERGDITGSSFAFIPKDVNYREENSGGKQVTIREINSVDLMDVGPVTYPAYEGTSVSMRDADRQEAEKSLETWRKQRQEQQRDADAVRVRADLVARNLA